MSRTYQVVASGILHFPNAVPDVKNILSFLETVDSHAAGGWLPWMSGGDDDPCQYGLLKELTPKKNECETNQSVKTQAEKIIFDIYTSIDSSFFEYYKFIGASDEVARSWSDAYRHTGLTHFAIKKYSDNEHMGPHPDSDSIDPVEYTASVYFNDDYEGGDLNFPDQGVSVKPTPGSIVIFPASFLHESLPIRGGIKYVANILGNLPENILNSIVSSDSKK